MIRALFILFNLIGTLFVNTFLQPDVSLQVSAPQSVEGGSEFYVQVTLDKGELASFSRFQQELPAGLTALSVNSANAVDFSFKDNRVRIIWLKLPETQQITFSYKIRVDERLKGNFDLKGSFSYIDNNERKTIELVPSVVTITPNPNIDPSLIVDIQDFEKFVIPDLTPKEKPGIACIRQKPVYDYSTNSYVVSILVSKKDIQKHAKIEEQVPLGFTAIEKETKGGVFTFNDQVAKFIWMDLPSDDYFVVSYAVIPNSNDNVTAPGLKGQFSYIEKERTVSIPVVEQDVNLASLNSVQVSQLINSIPKSMLIAEVDNTQQKKTTTSKNKKTSKYEKEYLLQPESGIYYRVQLAAGHKAIRIQRYFKNYEFKADVRKEIHEGWNKYSIGSFKDYKEARDYRVHVWNTTDIDDAFVSAYNEGKRITVQEALMVTNQKWYK